MTYCVPNTTKIRTKITGARVKQNAGTKAEACEGAATKNRKSQAEAEAPVGGIEGVALGWAVDNVVAQRGPRDSKPGVEAAFGNGTRPVVCAVAAPVGSVGERCISAEVGLDFFA